MAKEAGKNWKWYLNTGTVSSPTWTLIPYQKDGPFSVTQNMVDTTNKSDAGWTASTPGTKSWSGSLTLIYDKTESTHATMVDNAMDQTSTGFKLVGASGENWIGYGYCSIEFAVPVDGMTELTVTIEPEGAATYSAS